MIAALPMFLNLPAAAIAAGVAVPLLVLLYFLKLRRREMLVSSTFLWKKAIQDLQVNAPFQRLRRNLLLLLQLLIILFLCTALARPVIRHAAAAGKVAVILIDRSASMAAKDVNGHSRLDEAKTRAKELIDTLDKNSSAMVIAFDETAETIQAFSADKPALRHAVDSIRQTDRRSALKQAYQLAEAQATNFDPEQRGPHGPRPEVWLYSDGRVSDFDKLALAIADLKWTRIGTDQARNVGIVSFRAERSYEQPSQVEATARIANYGPDVVETTVKLAIESQDVPQVASVTLLPERWTRQEREQWQAQQAAEGERKAPNNIVHFSMSITTSAVLTASIVDHDGDQLAADDTAQVVVPPPKLLSGMLVTKGNYFLELAVRSVKLKETIVRTPASYEQMLQEGKINFDVVIFDDYCPTALPPAGNFIYFAAVPPDSKLKAVTEAGRPIRVDRRNSVVTWNADHPMLKGLFPYRLAAENTVKLILPLEAVTLVEGTDGPMVVLYREGRRTHLVTSFAVRDSTWPTDPTFPGFMNHAVQYLGIGADMDLNQSFAPGATPTIPRTALQQVGPVAKLQLKGPTGTIDLPIPETRDLALPPLDKVGLYTLEPPVPQFEKLAVNLVDPNESNLIPPEKPPGGRGVEGELISGKSRMELWWWLLAAAAIPMCMLEWWVYTRRVHL